MLERFWLKLLVVSLLWLVGCGQTSFSPARRTATTSSPFSPFEPIASIQSERVSRGQRMMEQVRVYVGTYTFKGSKGIYTFEFNLLTAKATQPRLVAETVNPSFLAIHNSARFLYAVNEIWDDGKEGTVSAFAIQPDGSLQFLNQQPSKGIGPCHLIVDKTGKFVLVANYGSGSVTVLPILSDGRLGEPTSSIQHEGKSVNPKRQERPHAHSINLDPKNRFAIVADLGIDKLLVYRFDATKGTLKPNDTPFASTAPGAGPRHIAFHPNGKFVYSINELNSTVTAYRYDPSKGILTEVQTVSTLPEGFSGTNTTAEIQVHPSGRFLYGSNRGHDSIAIFAIEEAMGKLTLVGHQPTHGRTPRNFSIDPTGAYLFAANQDSDNIVVFRIDQQTGKLEPSGQTINVPTPVCVKFLTQNFAHQF
ncbi:MAG: lactonase family protein [Armatimonadetes bacterium]|nr:lactonase family protein [Armatimonadota bacterium]MDW8027653.1 lactonase family protein [Armatimonadota bacterium]